MSAPGADAGPIVIVGAGHAGAQLCFALAAAGQGALVHLVGDEAELPYQRPPLSKSFLKSADETLQAFRPDSWYEQAGITLHRGDAALAIDRARSAVTLKSGRELAYGRLVLATGAAARGLPQLADNLANVVSLRSAADAVRLRGLFGAAQRVTVLGGGFIGLEIAATAATLGKTVTVLEAAPRLLQRSVSPELAAFVLDAHRASGIDIRLGVGPVDFEFDAGRVSALRVGDRSEPVELLVLGIGAAPRVELARAAGLTCDDGIVVDANLRSSDAAILAIGDCARFPVHGGPGRLRLESVQNATDQARTALATLLGRDEPYRALPWFWSDQGGVRLQMAGLMPEGGTRHRRPGASAASFSLLHYAGERLVCVESVNAPLDHLSARKLLEAGRSPPPEVACDPAVALKTHL